MISADAADVVQELRSSVDATPVVRPAVEAGHRSPSRPSVAARPVRRPSCWSW